MERAERTSATRTWIVNHEESWIFVAAYIGLAVILSAFISLFWLVLLVVVHLAFEVVSHQAHHDAPSRVWSEALWAVKLDIGLVFFAFAVTLYLPFVFGVLGLGAASRAAAAAPRFLVLQRSIRAVLISVDDAALVARGLVRSKKPEKLQATHAVPGTTASAANADASGAADAPARARGHAHAHGDHGETSSWRSAWGFGGWASLGFTAVSLLLVVLAPLLTDYGFLEALHVMADEMHPWP